VATASDLGNSPDTETRRRHRKIAPVPRPFFSVPLYYKPSTCCFPGNIFVGGYA